MDACWVCQSEAPLKQQEKANELQKDIENRFNMLHDKRFPLKNVNIIPV